MTQTDNTYAMNDQRDFGDEHTVKRPPTPNELSITMARELEMVAENIASNARRLARCVEALDFKRSPAEDLEYLSTIINQTIARVCESWPLDTPRDYQATGLLHITIPDAVFDRLRNDSNMWGYSHSDRPTYQKEWLSLRGSMGQNFSITLFREHSRTQAEVAASTASPDGDCE